MATKPAPLSTFANSPAVIKQTEIKNLEAEIKAEEKMRQKVFRVTPAQDRKIKEFCAHSDRSIQDVVMEGINLVLKAKGLPSI
jgi:hypothetical protein